MCLTVMLHETNCNDDFQGTQRCNVGTMLLPFETMSQQCCNAVLRQKSLLRIVPCNIPLRFKQGQWNTLAPRSMILCVADNSPLWKREENWAELTFAQTPATVTRDRGWGVGGNWPVTDRRVPSNHPTNNWAHFSSSSLLDSKVANGINENTSKTTSGNTQQLAGSPGRF